MIHMGVEYLEGENGERVYLTSQNQENWENLRLGIPTSSEFDRIIREPKKTGGFTKASLDKIDKYIFEKLAESHTGSQKYKGTFSRAMETGSDREQYAVMMYERQTGHKTVAVGFVTDAGHNYGCSPDRKITGLNRLVEIKSPDPDTHLKYAHDTDTLKEEYFHQTQGQMFVWKCIEAVDNFSYHPLFQPVRLDILPDETYQKRLADDMEYYLDRRKIIADKLISKGYLNA